MRPLKEIRSGDGAADVVDAGKRCAFFRRREDDDEFVGAAAVNVGVGFQLADLFCDHDDDFVDPGLFENLSQVLVVVDTDDAQAVFKGSEARARMKELLLSSPVTDVFARGIEKRMDDAAENRQRGGEKEEGKRRRFVGKVKPSMTLTV